MLVLRAALATALAFSATAFAPLSASASEPYFKFSGGGWGHGIGLSQYGARGYALQGKTYGWILAHYFQGTRLETKPSVTVRVNLDANASARSSWRIQAGSDTSLTVYDTNNTTDRSSIAPSSTVWITVIAGNTRVSKDVAYVDAGVTKHKPGAVINYFTGSCTASAGGLVRIVGSSGPFGHTGVSWRGQLYFVPSGDAASKAINYVGIESYLYGVVPRESPSSWPAEALKAQAVAARSYAYQDAKSGRTIYCSTKSQVYNGYSRPGSNHEAPSTNAAVNATKGKVVWYGTETEPVKTFFSSSTGGHTASIQDVWTESTPKEYYTGVPDADQDNPNYRWSVGPLTSTTVSSKVRTKDANGEAGLQYSAPYPNTIVGMSLERAASGYTHHLTIRWSNGQSFRIKGDTMRSALSMKSTKFSVSTTYPTTVTKYQQNDGRLAWVGPWTTARNPEASGSTYAFTPYYSSQLVANFTGTGIVWIGNRGPAYGKAAVYVDGALQSTVDLYSARGLRQQRLFSRTGLAAASHTLVIRVLANRNARSTGNGATVDRIDVINGSLGQAIAPVSRYEQSHSRIAKLGDWRVSSADTLSGGSHVFSAEPGSSVILSFYGSRVAWTGAVGPAYGAARVSVDGSAPTTVTLNATSPATQRLLWTSAALSTTKAHRLLIEVVGPTSGGTGAISVDRLDVTGGWALEPSLSVTRVEETDPRLVRSGYWGSQLNAAATAGHYIASRSAGASSTIAFDGNGVTWLGSVGPASGRADVYLDGKLAATVDLYKSTTAHRQTIFRRTRLTTGRHSLTIRVRGNHSAGSRSSWVNVDAIDVAGRPLQ